MRSAVLIRFLDPFARAVARQLSHPRGWFGRTIMTRVLNRGNRDLIEATLDGVPLEGATRLLDVGFGGGQLLETARRRGVRALSGVDPSEEAVSFLRGRLGTRSPAEVRLEVGAVEALPFPDRAFDVVASTNTVYFWPDLPRAFGELHRVLRPGGRLTIGFSGAAKLRGFGSITRHGFAFHDGEDLRRAAAGAGFEEVDVLALHGPVTEGDFVLRAFRPGRPPEPSATPSRR